MPDETTRAIDRFFDVLDNGVDTAHRLLHRSSQTEEKLQPKQRRREIIDAEHAEKKKTAKPAGAPAAAKPTGAPAAKPAGAPAAKPTTSPAVTKPHFYIVESVDPKSGGTIYVVTDGRAARTECATREFAAQILKALEKAP